MQLQEADRSGTRVVEAKGVSFGYGDVPVIRDLTTTISRGDKVGIIGPNGSGKSTLLKLLLGEMPPQSGTIRHGTKLEVAYFDQTKAALDDEATVQQNISAYDTIPINGQPQVTSSVICKTSSFPPDRARSLVKFLSGGERSRLLLARLFTKPSNVLVLDEPTNDLDMETLELLEGLLVEYAGTVLVVSHDRAFLDDVATSVLSVEPDGEVREYDGGYSDYLRASQERVAAQPKATPAATAGPSRSRSGRARAEAELQGEEGARGASRARSRPWRRRSARPTRRWPIRRSTRGIKERSRPRTRISKMRRQLVEAYARWEELAALAE